MRFAPVFAAFFLLVGCATGDDSATDSNEINEARGSLDRPIEPPMAVPENAKIGAKLAEVVAKATAGLTGAKKSGSKDCTETHYKDAAKQLTIEHLDCKTSTVVRFVDDEGVTLAEHGDMNKDGKVDRWTGTDGALIQLVDNNFDGKIDTLIESVDKVKDFSMKGYNETFPKSKFLHRVREDRNRDGKFEHEKLTARGQLPPAQAGANAPSSSKDEAE